MTLRQELLALQRHAVQRAEDELRQTLVPERPAIRRSFARYQHELDAPFTTTTREELARAASSADIVYVGDYHTLEAAQRAFVWLLEAVRARRGEVAIALEMLEPRHQSALDAFLEGSIGERAFLARTRHAERWGFAWEHYAPILDFARRTRSRVHGFDRSPRARRGTLERRESFAAEVLAGLAAARPRVPLLVLVGDLHLAQRRLPARVDARLERLGAAPRERVVVFQNSELLYWKLAALGREQTTEVVRLDGRRFCLMGATPLAKVSSFLDWTRSRAEEDPGEDDEEAMDEALALVSAFFGVERPFELPERKPASSAGERVLAEISPRGIAARTTLDRSAEEAALRLRAFLTPHEKTTKAGQGDRFYALVLEHALGSLGSLVVDHARARLKESDFERFLADTRCERLSGKRAAARRTAAIFLRHVEAEASSSPRFPSLRHESAQVREATARALGERLASLLHRALLEGRVERSRLRSLISQRFDAPLAARTAYLDLARDASRVPLVARTRRFLRASRAESA